MRKLMSLLLVLLFCSVQPTLSSPIALKAPSCCFQFSNSIIPLNRIVSFYWTDSSCAKKAIVFQTITKREICVDPQTSWVSGHVDKVNMRTTAATTAKTLSTTV